MENKDQTMLVEGYDDAIIGIDTSTDVFRVIYDRDKMAEMLEEDGMSSEGKSFRINVTTIKYGNEIVI